MGAKTEAPAMFFFPDLSAEETPEETKVGEAPAEPMVEAQLEAFECSVVEAEPEVEVIPEVDEEATRLAAEEEAKKSAEEAAARLAAEEAKNLAEEEAARLAAEEEAKKSSEEAAARLAAEEEA